MAARFGLGLRPFCMRGPRMGTTADSKMESLLPHARAGDASSLGRLLGQYQAYLRLLAKVQIDRRMQSKVDESDLVQEVFLEATRKFDQFRGGTEAELIAWLREILASKLIDLFRHYYGAQRRKISLEQDLAVGLDRSSRLLDRGLVSP